MRSYFSVCFSKDTTRTNRFWARHRHARWSSHSKLRMSRTAIKLSLQDLALWLGEPPKRCTEVSPNCSVVTLFNNEGFGEQSCHTRSQTAWLQQPSRTFRLRQLKLNLLAARPNDY